MSPKSVILIEPAARVTNVFENYMRLPLMGLLYLGTILHERGHRVRVINESLLGREVDPFELQADVFCLSALTVSASRAKLLAGQLKAIYPESRVLIGGIHASLVPEEFTDIADQVIVGEAEEIIVDLIEGRLTEKIVQGARTHDLEALPLVNYGLLENHEAMDIIPIISSRGCPFDCNFCTVTRIFGRKYRMLTPTRVVAEIKHALGYFRTRSIFFYDDNLTANHRRIDELCDLLIAEKLNISWTAQVRSDLARDPALVAKMARAGCQWLFIGFESIDDEALKAMHKGQTREDIVTAIRTFQQHGIYVHGMFIFGADEDTPETMRATVDFAIEHHIDTVQFMIMTPFPGTEYHARIAAEGRLYHHNWDYYNAMFVVFQPKRMPPMKLQTLTYEAYQRFYSLRRTTRDTLTTTWELTINALVWNFDFAHRYNFDILLRRGAAKAIIGKYSPLYAGYLRFLSELEKRHVLGELPADAPTAAH